MFFGILDFYRQPNFKVLLLHNVTSKYEKKAKVNKKMNCPYV